MKAQMCQGFYDILIEICVMYDFKMKFLKNRWTVIVINIQDLNTEIQIKKNCQCNKLGAHMCNMQIC